MKTRYKTYNVTEYNNSEVIYRNSYWLCVDGNPEKALYYLASPQCNSSKIVAENVLNATRDKIPFDNVQIVFIDLAFRPDDVRRLFNRLEAQANDM